MARTKKTLRKSTGGKAPLKTSDQKQGTTTHMEIKKFLKENEHKLALMIKGIMEDHGVLGILNGEVEFQIEYNELKRLVLKEWGESEIINKIFDKNMKKAKYLRAWILEQNDFKHSRVIGNAGKSALFLIHSRCTRIRLDEKDEERLIDDEDKDDDEEEEGKENQIVGKKRKRDPGSMYIERIADILQIGLPPILKKRKLMDAIETVVNEEVQSRLENAVENSISRLIDSQAASKETNEEKIEETTELPKPEYVGDGKMDISQITKFIRDGNTLNIVNYRGSHGDLDLSPPPPAEEKGGNVSSKKSSKKKSKKRNRRRFRKKKRESSHKEDFHEDRRYSNGHQYANLYRYH